MGSLSPAQLSNEEEEDDEDNPTASMTMKDIMSSVRGRKRSGVPMPSTVERRKQQLKKRREERKKRSTGAAVADGAAEGGTDGATAAQDSDAAAGGDGAASEVAAPQAVSGGPPDGDGDAATEGVVPAGDELPAFGEPVVVAPKVTVDEDGNIVIDKDSLCISAGTGLGADTGPAEVVTLEANDNSKHITSATFAKRDSATRWTAEDTQKFFESLSRFGTDFALIEHAFPKRSRRQIKLKYKREERENPKKIDEYLKARPTCMTIADTRKTLNMEGDHRASVPGANAAKSVDGGGSEDPGRDGDDLVDGVAAPAAASDDDDDDDAEGEKNEDDGSAKEADTGNGFNSPAEQVGPLPNAATEVGTVAESASAQLPQAAAFEEEEEEEQYLY